MVKSLAGSLVLYANVVFLRSSLECDWFLWALAE